MKLTKQTEAELLKVYYQFWEANLSADMEKFAFYLVDDFSIFGSANGEVFYSKQDAVRFYTATADEMRGKAELRNRNVGVQSLDTNSVIVREESDLYVLIGNEWTFYGHARISCIVKHIDGDWKAVHQHASFPDHRTEEGQQLASEKIEKENLELREAVKRRTVELESKNRELEIEAALERVRTVAMGMNKPEDMLNICRIISQQLEFLNVKHIRNVQTAIIYESKGTYLNYEYYVKHDKLLITDVDYNRHTEHSAFVNKMLESEEAFYSQSFIGKELKDWYAYQKTTAQFADAYLEQATSLNYYMYSIGAVVLSMSTYEPLNEAEINLFKRFRNVFDLAYRRFFDIEKAESQARESKIQLALERVRARTMAMQHSDELAEASFLLDSQVRALGIKTQGCAFNIYGETDSTEWFSSEMGAMPAYKTPRENLFLRYYEAGEKGESIHIEEFAGEACIKHYEYLSTVPGMGDGIREMLKAGGSLPTRQIDHAVYFKYGYLLFLTLEPVPEAHETFKRFAKVFEQTYTRFLDLQKAEEQALRAEQDIIEIKSARKKAEDALTELQLTQKQLIQSEKMASLGELTAGIAHEIQNPLNFVNNFSEVSKELLDEMREAIVKGDLTEVKDIVNNVIQNLEKITHHGKRADGIVKGMLQHSRSGTGQKELTDINDLCDEYLRLAYHGLKAKDKSFNAKFEINFDAALPKIKVVPQDIGRVILNLINNAFYTVSERLRHFDKLSAQPDNHFEPTVTIGTKLQKNELSISVHDNGNGIPQQVLDKIFQPFFTTKPTGQGTGLGLSLSYDIVKAHSGRLEVETKEGVGTEFRIVLPIS